MIPNEDSANGRLTESRLGRKIADSDGEMSQWGSVPAPPFCDLPWIQSFQTNSAQLSNGLGTDRQWYAYDFTACLIKGFCQYDLVADALAAEGLYPVKACCDGIEPLAMATLWFNLIHDSVCGTYHEVVLSFDVSRAQTDTNAFRVASAKRPWAVLYPNFGSSRCDAQFLHSLWINSPLSITWGREMQGFPKHPRPVTSTITDQDSQFAFDLRWDNDVILYGQVQKRFGMKEFLSESWGLVTTHPLGGVLNFLFSPSFDVPIVMPTLTATQNNVPRNYVGHLWKGLHPASVQVWPWGAEDVLEMGEISVDTGCEDHNGHRLLRLAEFDPVSVTYIPRMSAFVEEDSV